MLWQIKTILSFVLASGRKCFPAIGKVRKTQTQFVAVYISMDKRSCSCQDFD